MDDETDLGGTGTTKADGQTPPLAQEKKLKVKVCFEKLVRVESQDR